ncbi:hypothetical protein CLIB1423_07S04874 [[Candida] railenensis]|uniref:Uncharacterized protein n=1 Tax=[Candida] railenensis TaxID=45579 RepID=A0A9P0QNU4_9ASCO|nr:hypothetical protein CLIB1423_07S04874 [[Candida] railenensis]
MACRVQCAKMGAWNGCSTDVDLVEQFHGMVSKRHGRELNGYRNSARHHMCWICIDGGSFVPKEMVFRYMCTERPIYHTVRFIINWLQTIDQVINNKSFFMFFWPLHIFCICRYILVTVKTPTESSYVSPFCSPFLLSYSSSSKSTKIT